MQQASIDGSGLLQLVASYIVNDLPPDLVGGGGGGDVARDSSRNHIGLVCLHASRTSVATTVSNTLPKAQAAAPVYPWAQPSTIPLDWKQPVSVPGM